MDHTVPASSADAPLGIPGYTFADLHAPERLASLYDRFCDEVEAADAVLWREWDAYRRSPDAPRPAIALSNLLVAMAPHVSRFVCRLFDVASAATAHASATRAEDALFRFKVDFVRRRVLPLLKAGAHAAAHTADDAVVRALVGNALSTADAELAIARAGCALLDREKAEKDAITAEIDALKRWCAARVHDPAFRHWVIFRFPENVDPWHLVDVERPSGDLPELAMGPHARLRHRDGFKLTDPRMKPREVMSEIHYCVLCHERDKDSCAKGLYEAGKGGGSESQPLKVVVNPLGIELNGCPLNEKISEMHLLRKQGDPVGALALVTVDNPMCPGTGHRICNDCMKSCIYQKQEPVNIPQAETRTLKDVLELPWGFEIYSLLTRWNPLNLRRPVPREASGRKVLVVGLGPAGFTVAHHLMNDGHAVVGIDGLKIEPLPEALSGVDPRGKRSAFRPIHDVRELYEQLGSRVMAGFGGVAEYGITVRWDKNFLKVIRLLLERRREFAMFGGVRFGGTVTLEDAWAMGFDHVAVCVGAGKPTVLEIPNGLARGVRAASDFLMALQLTGAAKPDSIANMQLRLPVVVIGGGLTAIDTATESLAYYVVQVEKFLVRYDALAAGIGEAAVREAWDDQEREIGEEFLAHARAIRKERAEATDSGREPRIVELLNGWGGVTMAYRRRLVDSPSYTLNHEEVEKALEEGIVFAEGLTPAAVDVDNYGAVKGMRFKHETGDKWLPAHTVFVAAGTQPNTVLSREDPDHFVLDGKYFAACDEQGEPVKPQRSTSKPDTPDVLLSRAADGRFVSYFGDVHPSYFGNVVKAMGSAKQGYPVVSRVLATRPPQNAEAAAEFAARLADRLVATVERVERLTPTIIEVVLRAPLAAEKFQPGQFYRLQNFETLAPVIAGTRMQMEGLALTGAWVDRDKGLVSTIVLEMGGSSDLCAMLQKDEPVILMGPTGAPTEIEPGETVVLCGGGLGNAVLFSIGQAFRAAGSKVLYFAGYKKTIDRYKIDDIEKAADVVVWCCDEQPGFEPRRPQDRTFVGNIVQAMDYYAKGRLGTPVLRMEDADRLIAIGSDRMMAAVARARHDVLKTHLKSAHVAIGSINSPMQCMMKEICAQCLQPHRDPVTGETSWVFSCFNQDQPLDRVDFSALNERLKQNSLAEKLTAKWIRHCMPELRRQRTFA